MKAVFLDRDNTLIENDGDLGRPDEVRLRPQVARSLRALREEGYRLIVVTNQGGVARGRYTERDVDQVHQRIAELVDAEGGMKGIIDRFYYCPYHPEGTVEEYRREHPWRKPQPGMLIQAARDLKLDLSQCWMIGDQSRDVEAGAAAGCRTILIGADDRHAGAIAPAFHVSTISEAVDAVLNSGTRAHAASAPAVAPAAPSTRRALAPRAARPAEARDGEHEPLRRALHDLAEEIRTERLRRTEFTMMRMAAGLCQLGVLLLALLALLGAGSFEHFMMWMAGAVLMQLVAIAFLLLDLRGG